MRKMMTVSLMIAISFGLVLASVSFHSSLSAFAQANSTKKNATSQQSSGNKSSGGGGGAAAVGGKPSNTPPSTVATMKGPKAAGTANQLNQVEGNNTQTLSKNTNIANKPGVAGLAGESNATGK
jgi:hypothetical protein